MKNLVALILFLIPVFAFAQYPANPNKIRLGYQTTADGLIWRGVAADTSNTPTGFKQYAYVVLDTVNVALYGFVQTAGRWQELGGGGGVDSLKLLNDVNTTGATAGSVLKLNSAGVWVDSTDLQGILDSTRIVQDSIAVYYQDGGEVGRDTIRVPGGGSLPTGNHGQVIGYDNTNTGRSQWIGSPAKMREVKGVMAHIGDSNTNGRPGYRSAYYSEWFCEGCPFEGWTSYNIGQNGSTLQGWVSQIDSPTDSILKDFSTVGGGGLEYEPLGSVWRCVNGDADGRKPDLIFVSLGTNDENTPGGRATIGTEDSLRFNLAKLVNFLLDSTDAYLVLRMPQPFANENFFSTNWVNEAEVAEASRRLRVVYREWANRHSRVEVYDSHQHLFGDHVNDKTTESLDNVTGGQLIEDALHPTSLGYRRLVQQMTNQLLGIPLPRVVKTLPQPYWQSAKWGKNFWFRSKGTFLPGSRGIELEASIQASLFGTNYGNTTGPKNIKAVYDNENFSRYALAPILQELLSVSGDTVYLYDYITGKTARVFGYYQSQWVTGVQPNYPQIQAVFIDTFVVSTPRTILFYSKTKAPFVPDVSSFIDGTGETASGNTYRKLARWADSNTLDPVNNIWQDASSGRITFFSGAYPNTYPNSFFTFKPEVGFTGETMRIEGQTGSGLGLSISAPSGLLVTPSTANAPAIQVNQSYGNTGVFVNSSGPRGFLATLNSYGQVGYDVSHSLTSTFLANTGSIGFRADIRADLDHYYTTGAYLRAYTARTTKGSNADAVYGVDAYANSAITTAGTHGAAGRFTAQTANVYALDLRGNSAQISPLVSAYRGSSEIFRIDSVGGVNSARFRLGVSSGPIIRAGAGSPESSVTAPIGSVYSRTDGSASTTLYVKESGTGNTGWVAHGSGLSDGDKGDITVSSSGTAWTIDAAAVSYSKIQNVTNSRLLGNNSGGAAEPSEISLHGSLEFKTATTIGTSDVAGSQVIVATDANGRIAVSHSLGSTPTAVLTTPIYDATHGPYVVQVYSVSTTNVIFQILDMSGAAITSTTIDGFYYTLKK